MRRVTLGGPVVPLAFSSVGLLLAVAADGVCLLEPMGNGAGAGNQSLLGLFFSFRCILLIMLLQLSQFFPLCCPTPSTPIPSSYPPP